MNDILYGVINELDSISGSMGVGTEYYKGKDGYTPVKGVDYFTQEDIDEIIKDINGVDLTEYAKKAELAKVSTTGEYSDLKNKPTLFDGDYNSLTNKPTIPEAPDLTGYATESWVEGKGYLTEHQDLTNYATKSDVSAVEGKIPSLTGYVKSSELSSVATSGDYDDLENKPTLFSGNYEDLTNKPTIPDAYTLPVASTDTLGGVKVDGETITIADGVISSAGGGSGGQDYEVITKDYATTFTKNSATSFYGYGGDNVNDSNDRITESSYPEKILVPIVYNEGNIELRITINNTPYIFVMEPIEDYSNYQQAFYRDTPYVGEDVFLYRFNSGTYFYFISTAGNIRLAMTNSGIFTIQTEGFTIDTIDGSDCHTIITYKKVKEINTNSIPNYSGIMMESNNYCSILTTNNPRLKWVIDKGILTTINNGKWQGISNKSKNCIIFDSSASFQKGYGGKSIQHSFVIGQNNRCSDNLFGSMLVGKNNNFGADYAFCIGENNSLINDYSLCVGKDNEVYNQQTYSSMFALGQGLNAKGNNYFVIGRYSDYNMSSDNYLFRIGNGTNDSNRATALTVDTTGNLAIAGTMSSSGADYAEYFEWKDHNPEAEDRVGYIVALDGDKITLANEGDYILGVVSGTATVLGDNAEWNWAKRWLTDDFGRVQYEDLVIHHEAEGEIPAYDETVRAPIVNPDYDPEQTYTKRADRPEWSAVGMMGKLYVRDDGTCQVNGYCKPVNGVATSSTTGMRVIERVSDNVIRVVLK